MPLCVLCVEIVRMSGQTRGQQEDALSGQPEIARTISGASVLSIRVCWHLNTQQPINHVKVITTTMAGGSIKAVGALWLVTFVSGRIWLTAVQKEVPEPYLASSKAQVLI
jgi:hypothetical protein